MKKKFIIKTTILLLITTALIFVYFFIFKILENKSQKIADLQVFIDTEINKAQQSFNLKRQNDLIDSASQTIENHFLKSSDVPIFLSSIESIGSKTGAIIVISSVEETNTPDSATSLSLKVGASGSYTSIYKTLVEIENLPYLSSINNISISSDKTASSGLDKDNWSLNLNLVIKSYIK